MRQETQSRCKIINCAIKRHGNIDSDIDTRVSNRSHSDKIYSKLNSNSIDIEIVSVLTFDINAMAKVFDICT